jgi:hypothetical protein
VRLVNAAGLLRDWTNVYDWSRNTSIASFVVPYAYHTLETRLPAVLPSDDWALTLLSGADWVAPAVEHSQVHVYARPGTEGAVRARLVQRLHAKVVRALSAPSSSSSMVPVEAGETMLHLLAPYYGEAAFVGVETIRGMRVVSPLQLYLDLARFPVRGPEAADAVLRTVLAPHAKLSASDVASLVAE